MYVNEINGIKDGQNGMWWEVYKKKPNGEITIAEKPIDKIKLDPGETLEWRLASEEPGGCGGGSSPENSFTKDVYRGKSSSIIRQNYMPDNSQLLLYN